jgi:hypothetical protein
MKASDGWKVLDFYKFRGKDNKTTKEHISMFIAQLGEAGIMEHMRIRNFSLSLIGTVFSGYSSPSLQFCSIGSWPQLEKSFMNL